MKVLSVAYRTVLVAAFVSATWVQVGSQSSTGLSPNWRDLEAWTRALPSTRETEHGLGLQLAGSTGTIMISFAGRVASNGLGQPPRTLDVVVAPALFSNPNVIRTPSLRLTTNEGEPDSVQIDFGSSLRSDNPAPGAVVRSAAATMPAADFVRLATAKNVRGSSFGSDVTFRPDQLKAMLALAARLKLPLR